MSLSKTLLFDMTYDEFNELCSSMAATSYVVQWRGAHVWKVGGKVFAIGGWEKSSSPAFTFKASDYDFNLLKDELGFRPAPYMASRGLQWLQMYDVSKENIEELNYYIKESYRIVSVSYTHLTLPTILLV